MSFRLLFFAVAAALAWSVRAAELPPLLIPVEGVVAEALRDTFAEGRIGLRLVAIDIAAAGGTRVVAVADGGVARLFRSIPGGITLYEFDSDRRFAIYVAHLDRLKLSCRCGCSPKARQIRETAVCVLTVQEG